LTEDPVGARQTVVDYLGQVLERGEAEQIAHAFLADSTIDAARLTAPRLPDGMTGARRAAGASAGGWAAALSEVLEGLSDTAGDGR
jgi:hypothetical protein